jgi:hypothetical protein
MIDQKTRRRRERIMLSKDNDLVNFAQISFQTLVIERLINDHLKVRKEKKSKRGPRN